MKTGTKRKASNRPDPDRVIAEKDELIHKLSAALEKAEYEKAQIYKQLNMRLEKYQRLFINSLVSIVSALEGKVDFLAGHSSRVSEFSLIVARELGAGPQELLQDIRLAALLHDIGKVGIPEHILCKAGPLTQLERQIVEEHPKKGADLLLDIGYLENVSAAILHHHERWDGSGYPDGLQGEQIPLISRIIGACEAYDCMVSYRPYRRKMLPAAAVQEIVDGGGKQFDPQVAAAISRCFQSGMLTSVTSRHLSEAAQSDYFFA